jgi:DNA replication and repair protein RecF
VVKLAFYSLRGASWRSARLRSVSGATLDHRAEVLFYVGGRDIREILSRGRQKVFCHSLALSQVEILCRTKEQNCTFLIDDFTSELDAKHRQRVLALLNKLGIQVFATTVETLDREVKTYTNAKAFHVKRGRLEEMV